jgi:hypothetical protein
MNDGWPTLIDQETLNAIAIAGAVAIAQAIPRGDHRKIPRHSLRREGGSRIPYFTFWKGFWNASKMCFRRKKKKSLKYIYLHAPATLFGQVIS